MKLCSVLREKKIVKIKSESANLKDNEICESQRQKSYENIEVWNLDWKTTSEIAEVSESRSK